LEIQANLLNALLSHRLITPVEGAFRYAFMLAPIMAMMLGLRRLRPRWTLWMLVALLGAVLGGAGLLLAGGHMWIAPGSALLGLIAIYPLWSWRRLASLSAYIATELEKLEAEHDPLERARPILTQADFVERQIGLLRSAIDRERDLRRFLIDRIAQMPDAVAIIDPSGKVVIANDGAVALWHSLGGRDVPKAIGPLLARLTQNGEAMIAGGAPTAWQADAATDDGRSFAVQCEPQRAADDAVIGAVIRITETTEAVLAERQREEVLQLLSHDMRAPQISILTLLDGDTTGAIAAPVAQRVRDYAERTLGLADGFVQLARAESLRFEPQPIDLGDVMREASDALWPQAVARHVTVRCEVPDDEVLVLGDRSLLTRMFVNLIENATRFSAAGQVITVSLAASQDTCEATVEDHGAGIAPEQLARLFERFTSSEQGSAKGSAKGVSGVGLGLAFVHATVLRHAGRIDCISELGRGTRFTLRFATVRDPS
jgi:signal transduction histidine kinase